MVIFLQRTFTSLVNAHVGRTQIIQPDRFIRRAASLCSVQNGRLIQTFNDRYQELF